MAITARGIYYELPADDFDPAGRSLAEANSINTALDNLDIAKLSLAGGNVTGTVGVTGAGALYPLIADRGINMAPSTYPQGVSMAVVVGAGWPGTGVGSVHTFQVASPTSGRVVQWFFERGQNNPYVRSSVNASDTWGIWRAI